METGRICSILFYFAISLITSLMAKQIITNVLSESCFVNGRRTRQNFNNRLFITGIFVVLFLCSALRFNIGNDYWKYAQTAHEVYVGGYVVTEPGFNFIVKLIYGLCGSECYELVFALFAFATIFVFLKAFYKQSVDFGLTFFLFMTMGLYFQTFNTIRYYFALAIVLYSIKYVISKDWISFVVVILFASLFHKSVLLVIPVYWIATFEWKKCHIIAGFVTGAFCFVGQKIILKLALILYPSYKGTVYLEGSDTFSSMLRIAIILGLYIWFIKYKGEKLKEVSRLIELQFYVRLNLLSFIVCAFFSFLPVVTRIIYYFSVTQLFMIPLIINNIADTKIRKRVEKMVFVVSMVYFFFFLLRAHQDGVKLLPYRSWMFEVERLNFK